MNKTNSLFALIRAFVTMKKPPLMLRIHCFLIFLCHFNRFLNDGLQTNFEIQRPNTLLTGNYLLPLADPFTFVA